MNTSKRKQWVGISWVVWGLFLAPAAFASVAMNGGTITITDDAVLSIGSSQAFTLSFWVKPGGASASFRTLYTWRSGTGSADAALRLGIQNNVTWPPDCLYTQFPTNGTPHVDDKKAYTGRETVWCRVTMTRGDDLKIRLYSYKQGGSEILAYTSTNTYTQALNATGNLILGSSTFNGKLAEVAFWKRELSGAERAALDAGGLPSAASGGAPDWCIPLFSDYSVETGGVTVSDTSTTSLDGPDHPIDRGATAPLAVTMVWPTTGRVVNHRTKIHWRKTPADATLPQTFTVYMDKSNPPTTVIAGPALEALECDSGVLDNGSTYYVRVDATSEGGMTQGVVQTFAVSTPSDHIYYVSPNGDGAKDGTTPGNVMAYADFVTAYDAGGIESDAAIVLIEPDTTIFYEYEGVHPTPVRDWPDLAYYSQTVLQFGISRVYADFRRIGRFVNGDYWVVGPVCPASYTPGMASITGSHSGSAVINGMMIDPTGAASQGLDERFSKESGYSTHYSASLNRGGDLPFVIDTYPCSIINCYSIPEADAVQQGDLNQWFYLYDVSIVTVIETPIANNIWFRPTYRAYSGRAVQYQWSDVMADRLPQLDLNCTKQLLAGSGSEARQSNRTFATVERIVTRPHMELIGNWLNARVCCPWNASDGYAGYYAKETSVAYLGLYCTDLGTLEAKKRLLAGCIQRGLDIFGLVKQGKTNWFGTGDGATCIGKYWPVIFAGILLEDSEMQEHGIVTGQHENFSWTRPNNRTDYQENMTAFQIRANFYGEGLPFWDTFPWEVHYASSSYTLYSARDITGTVTCTNGSAVVVGQVGETFGDAAASDRFVPVVLDGSTRRVNDDSKTSVSAAAYVIQSIDRVSSPPTLTLTTPFGGTTVTDSAFVIADYVYLGRQWKHTDGALGELAEFDASWDGKYWWNEKPQEGLWRLTGSTIPASNSYHDTNRNAMSGLITAAYLMQKEGAFPAVEKWNEPAIFWLNDDYLDRWSNGSYCDGWVYNTGKAQWTQWPLDPWDPGEPAPSKATGPNPADGATNVSEQTAIGWTSGARTVSHNVYFGTESNNLSLVAGNWLNTVYVPDMTYSTTYYWRIDEVGDSYTTQGDEWSFTTRAAPVTKKIGLKKSE